MRRIAIAFTKYTSVCHYKIIKMQFEKSTYTLHFIKHHEVIIVAFLKSIFVFPFYQASQLILGCSFKDHPHISISSFSQITVELISGCRVSKSICTFSHDFFFCSTLINVQFVLFIKSFTDVIYCSWYWWRPCDNDAKCHAEVPREQPPVEWILPSTCKADHRPSWWVYSCIIAWGY